MYKTFTIYTYHTSFNFPLTINDPSGSLIHWRLLLNEFGIEVNYNKGTANTQANELPSLNISSETNNYENSDKNIVFILYKTNLKLKLNTSPHEVDFINVE